MGAVHRNQHVLVEGAEIDVEETGTAVRVDDDVLDLAHLRVVQLRAHRPAAHIQGPGRERHVLAA